MESVHKLAGARGKCNGDLGVSSVRIFDANLASGDVECKLVATLRRDKRSVPAPPAELTVIIFEYAARDSKRTAASLALVSRFARSIALPLLFRRLVIHNRATVHSLTNFLAVHTDVANHVRKLWMRQSIYLDISVILSCPRLERLAITPACFNALFQSDGIPSLVHLPETCRPSPHELLLFPGHVRWDDLFLGSNDACARSFLRGLTHLWLAQESQIYSLLRSEEALAGLSQLTHLASPVEASYLNTIEEVLDAFPKLQMFVLIPQTCYDPWTTSRTWIDWSYICSYCYEVDGLNKRLYFVRMEQTSVDDFVFGLWKAPQLTRWLSATSISLLTHTHAPMLFGSP